MKKIFLYGAAAFSVLIFFASCKKDFLDKQNQNQLSGGSFWQTKNDALAGITATYAALQSNTGSKWTWFEETYIASEYKTDEITDNKSSGYGASLHAFTYTTDVSYFTNLWSMCFAGINRANQCIENIPNVSDNAQTGLSDEEKQSLVSEAKFLRAHFYFVLLNYFENIPLITSVPKSDADYYPAEAPRDDIWAQVVSDLKEAEQSLPETREGTEIGRVTKYTASAYLGKVYLFQEKFDDAHTEFAKVIASGNYSLLPNFADNFNGKSENGPESLFEIQFSADRSNGNDERNPISWEISSGVVGGWELFYPSQWMVDELQKDKRDDGGYSDRVYNTIFFDDPGSVTAVIDQPGTYRAYDDVKPDLSYNYYFKKYTEPTDLDDNGYYTGLNMNLIRYADVLLMDAEALNEKGNTADAVELVNQVRARSHAAPVSTSISQADLREDIRHHERPCELAMEYQIRWPDMLRWSNSKVAPEKISDQLKMHDHEFADNFIEGKHNIYPVPFAEISKNPNIHQAPNW